ncbi:hypothetical protein CGCF413_v002153 [Colletotrichum fructicola]|nr:hypothetical protein CGCF413_v002153 [Colletotrichum fructicola]
MELHIDLASDRTNRRRLQNRMAQRKFRQARAEASNQHAADTTPPLHDALDNDSVGIPLSGTQLARKTCEGDNDEGDTRIQANSQDVIKDR